MTPDDYVYQRSRSEFAIRRLYRSEFPLQFTALIDGEQQSVTNVLTPPGRFSAATPPISVLPESGRTVSFAFESFRETINPEANGLLSQDLQYPSRPAVTTQLTFDHDDYGNQIRETNLGIISTNNYGDKRIVATTYALGGEALPRWIIHLTAQTDCTDLQGNFVSRRRDYYDGDPFLGLPLGQVGARALMHREEGFVNGETVAPALDQRSSQPGDPREPPGRSINIQRKEYDASGNLIEVLDPLAAPPGLATGHGTRIGYDARFNQYAVEEDLMVGDGSPDLSFHAVYDPGLGVVTGATDYNGVNLGFFYDTFGRIVASVQPGDSPALPTMSYDYIPGDPSRNRIYRYDAAGNLTLDVEAGAVSRIVSRQRLVSGETNLYVSVKYLDGLNRPLATVGQGDVPGHWIALSTVGMGRRGRRIEDWLPFDLLYRGSNAQPPPFLSIMTAGRPPPADLDGRPVVSSSLFLDPMGRIIRKVAPPDQLQGAGAAPIRRFNRTIFLPLESQIFDENDTAPDSPTAGTPMIKRLDGLGRIIETTEVTRLDDSGSATTTLHEWKTRYLYDLNQNLTEVTDSQGNVKWFRYDGLSRKLYLHDPDRGPVTFTHDDASNQTSVEDAKGQRLLSTFDGINRLLTEDYLDDQSPEFSYGRHPDVSYHYDTPHEAVSGGDGLPFQSAFTRSHVAWVEDPTGEEHFSYDARGRSVETLKRVFDWDAAPAADGGRPLIPFRTTQQFDAFNRIVARTYPDNDEIRQEFGSRNLIDRIYGEAIGDIIPAVAYFPNGKPRMLQYGNQVVTTMDQDPRLRLTRLSTERIKGGVTNRLIDFEYAYDALTTLVRIDDLRAAGAHPAGDPQRNSQSFQYDDLYRMTGVGYSFGLPGDAVRDDGRIDYRYDRIGNLLSQTSTIVQDEFGQTVTQLGDMGYGGAAGRSNRIGKGTEPGPHALTSDPARGDTLSYDGNGNLVHQGSQGYTWDFNDRMVRAETSDSISESRYDYSGRRVIHKVTNKADGQAVVTLYPTSEFEVRPHDEPVKYIFSGKTRVARVTTMLSNRPRVQRLRLSAGWNLAALSVSATNVTGQLGPSLAGKGRLLKYLPATANYETVADGEALTAGTILWIRSDSNQMVSVVGAYTDPGPLTAPASGFVGNASALPWTPSILGLTNASVWFFESEEQLWMPPPVVASNTPAPFAPVRPGGVFFASTAAPRTFVWPQDPRGIVYYHQDHLGSSSILTDRNGDVLEENTYYPFGQARTQRSVDGRTDPYQFTQKEHDAETGLNYFEARYQSPVYARFISVDPKLALNPSANLSGPQGLNFYAYCLNNPQAFTDPSGENCIGDAYDAVKAEVKQVINDLREFGSEVKAAGSGDVTGKGRFQAMIGVWFGDKDVVSLFVENHNNLDRNDDGTGKIVSKLVAGAIALDGRFLKSYTLLTTEENPKPDAATKFESKTKFKTRADTITADSPAATGITGGQGVKMKRGVDVKFTGSTPSLDANARLQADVGVGITGGGECSISSGNFEVSGKINGTAVIRMVKKDNLISIVVSGTGYMEIQGTIKIPQTGNLLQFPVRLSGEGTIQYVYTFDVDKVNKLKGL
jgi:RHS repeat-associated protein